MTPTLPTGRAAESWARLSLTRPAQYAPMLRAIAAATDDPDLCAFAEVLEHDLPVLIGLGCPVVNGWDPMVNPEEVLRGAR